MLQFRVLLENTQPLVWRRFLVPADFTLARLHHVIQAIMDWQDYHLHEFRIGSRMYGVPDPDYDNDREVLNDRTFRLQDFDLSSGDRLEYLYDFGDGWLHVLKLEEVLPTDADGVRPLCVAGEYSTPPEDVGGSPGTRIFCGHSLIQEHEDMKSWIGRPFDAYGFQPKKRMRAFASSSRGEEAVRKREILRGLSSRPVVSRSDLFLP